MQNTLVFVYGTLKSGLACNYLMVQGGAQSLGPAKLESGDFVLVYGSSFPYAVPFKPQFKERLWYVGVQTTIIGELFKANYSIMPSLDRLEGYPNHYSRTQVCVSAARDSEGTHTAWMYHRNEFLNDGDTICRDGVWWPTVSLYKFRKAVPSRRCT